jgi:hypothetical protein
MEQRPSKLSSWVDDHSSVAPRDGRIADLAWRRDEMSLRRRQLRYNSASRHALRWGYRGRQALTGEEATDRVVGAEGGAGVTLLWLIVTVSDQRSDRLRPSPCPIRPWHGGSEPAASLSRKVGAAGQGGVTRGPVGRSLATASRPASSAPDPPPPHSCETGGG